MSKRKQFGEILVDAGILDRSSLEKALQVQKGTSKRLGTVLEEMELISEKDVVAVLARQFGFKVVRNFAKYTFSEELLSLVNGKTALEKDVFPLKQEGRALYVAMVNPLDMDTIDRLSFETDRRIIPCVTTPAELNEAVAKHYLKVAEKSTDSSWWTILVVDDQELVRSAIVAALKKEGYLTLMAENGAEGLKTACQQFPHLIVTDTVMPRMDGVSMFRALQANSATQKIPVIALSSKSAAEEEAKILDMGYYDFVAKPINPTRLAARVRRALRSVYGEGGPPAL